MTEPRSDVLKKRVLIVDDEREVREVLWELLTLEGFEVRTAANGAMALTELLKDPYDLLITDLNMPQMNGLELVDRIHKEKMGIPMIIISSLIPETSREYVMERGVSRCISKPFHFEKFAAAVKDGLGLN